MLISDLSSKLQTYINKIEKETNRHVVIQTVPNLGISGMDAAFDRRSTDILVLLVKNIDNSTIEQSIAHEVTHGWIYYSDKYPTLEVKENITKTQHETISLLFTMIEDIVVNHIIFANGFPPFPQSYIGQVTNEIKAANKGRDYYHDFPEQNFKNKFMVFRYIAAWGLLEFFPIDKETINILSKFEKKFRYTFPSQYRMAKEIVETIKKYDIFSTEGYRNIILECLRLWQVDDLVYFVE